MANKTAVLFQRIKIGNKWTFRKVPTKLLPRLADGAYYLSWYEGTHKQMKRFRKFHRAHPDDLGDRSCHNIVQAVSTFLITYEIMAAEQCLKEMTGPDPTYRTDPHV